MLRVDGHDLAPTRSARFGDDRARRDEALLVREGEALPCTQRRECCREPCKADHGIEHDICVGVRGELRERGRIAGAGACEPGRDVEVGSLACEQLGVGSRGQCNHAVRVAVARQDVERLGADRARRPEDHDAAPHVARLRSAATAPVPGRRQTRFQCRAR